jgi:NAD(P)H-binding
VTPTSGARQKPDRWRRRASEEARELRDGRERARESAHGNGRGEGETVETANAVSRDGKEATYDPRDGATGTNGRFVVPLLAASVRVRAMVQDSSRAMDLQRAGAELVAADVDQPGTLDAALAGVDGCLLLSAVDKQLVERETRFVKRATKTSLNTWSSFHP